MLVAHRRSGKTTAGLADMLKRALEGLQDGLYAFIAPFYSQAKSIAWGILQALTKEVATDVNQSELRVTLLNGARIRLFGADKPDSLRGLRLDGAQCDEYADWKPDVFPEVLRPALADRGGWCVFSGTPKGPGEFKDLADHAQLNPDSWHYEYLPNSVTHILSAEECADMRTMMSDEVYQQEVECSWTAPRSGSYYGKLLNEADAQGRIGFYPHDPESTVEAAFDIGRRDSTAAWYWQTAPDGWRIIDADEKYGSEPADWIQLLGAKGYKYKQIWLPHDARAKTFATKRSTIEQFLAAQLPCKIFPELSVQQGIDAVRMVLPLCYFNHATTAPHIRTLHQYQRRWMPANQTFSNEPLHNDASHIADAFRGFALAAREYKGMPAPGIAPAVRSTDQSFTLEALFEDAERWREREEVL